VAARGDAPVQLLAGEPVRLAQQQSEVHVGDPRELLDGYRETSALIDAVGRDHGLILHAAAATGDGLLIVNLWPSRDRSEAAAGDPRRRTAIEHVGLSPAAAAQGAPRARALRRARVTILAAWRPRASTSTRSARTGSRSRTRSARSAPGPATAAG
jgi:hypothetical protein